MEDNLAISLSFRVLLSTKYAQQQANRHWQELEVEPVDGAPAPSPPAPIIPPVSAEKSKKKVGFAIPAHAAHAPSKVSTEASDTVPAALHATMISLNNGPSASMSSETTVITDICTALHKECINTSCEMKKCIGLLMDDETSDPDRHRLYLLDGRAPTNPAPVSLESLLANTTSGGKRVWRPPGGTITRRDRLYLATTLASSVLQLDGSWMKKHWRSRDIMFLPKEGSKADYSSPYISWKVHEEPPTAPTASKAANALLMAHLIRSEVLFALGITLIELSFGQTLGEMQLPEDIDPTNEALTNFKTGHRLLDHVYDESGTRYGDVVRRCLGCPFDVRDASLDNDEFQGLVFENIVMPLTDDLKDFEGSMRIR